MDTLAQKSNTPVVSSFLGQARLFSQLSLINMIKKGHYRLINVQRRGSRKLVTSQFISYLPMVSYVHINLD